MKKYHVYGIGAALVDTEVEVSDEDLAAMQVEKGLMTLVDEQRQHHLLSHLEGHLVHSRRASGGSAANSIIAINYFGGNTFFSGKVSNDDNGHFYMADLADAGVDTIDHRNGNTGEHGITGKCLVLITPDAERSMNTFLGISETFSSADLDIGALAQSEYLYMESYLVTSTTGRQAAIDARRHAELNGVKTALSLSDPGIVEHFGDGIREMIGERVDLVFCNEDEALAFAGCDSLEQAISMIKQVAGQIVVTLGARGALIDDGQQQWQIDGVPVEAVDTNGAGDMFAGAYLYAITHGLNAVRAGQFASHAAATVVSDYGPRLDTQQYGPIRQQFFN